MPSIDYEGDATELLETYGNVYSSFVRSYSIVGLSDFLMKYIIIGALPPSLTAISS